jgi:hypothetical protein
VQIHVAWSLVHQYLFLRGRKVLLRYPQLQKKKATVGSIATPGKLYPVAQQPTT